MYSVLFAVGVSAVGTKGSGGHGCLTFFPRWWGVGGA